MDNKITDNKIMENKITDMKIMDNKIVVNSRLVLSEKQIYLILKTTMDDKGAKENAEYYYNNPEKASYAFSYFCREFGDLGADVNDLLTLGILAYAKSVGEVLEDKDIHNDYLTVRKPFIKSIELDYIELDDEYIDTFDNMLENGLISKSQLDRQKLFAYLKTKEAKGEEPSQRDIDDLDSSSLSNLHKEYHLTYLKNKEAKGEL